MKNLLKLLLYCTVLHSTSNAFLHAETDTLVGYDSLSKRSPFGDAAPKPVVKQESKTPAAAPQPAKKPDIKVELSGVLKMGGKQFFSIIDKDGKDAAFETIELDKVSHLGHKPIKFDDKTLSLKSKGSDYKIKLGEVKDTKSTSTTSVASTKSSSGGNSNYGNYGGQSAYDYNSKTPSYSSDYYDYLDDDFDDDWEDWFY